MWPRAIILLFVGTISSICGYGTGAPKVNSVCLHRLPRHGVRSQMSHNPYIIRTVLTKAGGNYDITVNVTSTNGTTIKGFVVQLIPEVTELNLNHNRKPVGSFESNDDVQVMSCYSNSDTVTHTNNDDKDLVVIRGKIPIQSIHRKIIVHATLLQRFDIFWSEVTSDLAFQPDIDVEDSSVEWLKLVTNLTINYEAGPSQWEDDIKSRLNLGYYKMVNDWGHLRTKYIQGQLPFEDRFRKSTSQVKGESKTPNTGSKEAVVEEFLAGNFQLRESVLELFN
ncbi:putative defense protein Hdd11-like [Ylistrum balloti]|uniref:putative defense protein Hdd11-like n=1 Tax=Ylistrum balloti TaxID=509963 RepID=UPI0029058CA8|nr:putative defense protein Hdd11-like [Ylistrum balloti]